MSETDATFHPVAITGMHRSGTSMITRGLHESGLHLIGGDADALLAAADDNPEGFWENKEIVACNDELLEVTGGAWDNPPTLLPQAVDDPRVAGVVERATAALAGLAENDRWGFKDPRLCLTAAFWLDLQPDLRFVICVRNPLEVALSLKRRNQNSYSLGLSLWERYYTSILDLVPPDLRIVTHYDTYFLDPAAELGRVCGFIGLDPAPLNVQSDLRHHDVGVSFDEANLGREIRTIYQRLCEEAGAPPPRNTNADEGHVRRLVLDGTVAARHAEQRRQAIVRLEERLGEARKVEAELRDELARVRRESETRRAELTAIRSEVKDRFQTLAAGQAELQETTQELLAGNEATLDRLASQDAVLGAIHVKLRHVEETVAPGPLAMVVIRARRLFGRVARGTSEPALDLARAGVPVAKRTARRSAKRMPRPVRHRIVRVRRAFADGQAGKRIEERVERFGSHLPSPAQRLARKTMMEARRSGVTRKVATVSRRVGRRLPTPARNVMRGLLPAGVRRTPAAHRARPPRRAVPAPRPKRTEDGRRVDVPKGPAAFRWQKGYERMVAEFVQPATSWAVVTPGSGAVVRRAGSREAVPFPSSEGDAPAADSLSLIAILEALRVRGVQRLVLPEGSRRWYQDHPELRDHVARCHETLVDRPSAGAVFDLTSSPSLDRRGLLAEISDLSADLDATPAVLDWTGLQIGSELPGYTTFAPPASVSLPYFDRSIDVVVTTAERDRAEALRVASIAVLTVRAGADRLVVDDVTVTAEGRPAGPRVVVLAPISEADPHFEGALQARLAESGARLEVGPVTETDVDADVIVVLEAGILPLAAGITALASAVSGRPAAVAVAKIVAADGRIEQAGGMVFDDGTVVGIAAGTFDVRAPWHDYVRPVCWGGGMVAISAAVVADHGIPAPDDLLDWCAGVWTGGGAVVYRPQAAAVRTVSGPRPTVAGSAWLPQLSRRPRRPDHLGDGAWRFLIANDDPEALSPEARH